MCPVYEWLGVTYTWYRPQLHFHKDSLESLQTQVPKRMLPTEYGGDAGPLEDMKRE